MAYYAGRKWTRSELLERVGQIKQIASVEPLVYDEGKAKGVKTFLFDNGSGLTFEVLADRCLDIGIGAALPKKRASPLLGVENGIPRRIRPRIGASQLPSGRQSQGKTRRHSPISRPGRKLVNVSGAYYCSLKPLRRRPLPGGALLGHFTVRRELHSLS